jgi:hypothetical protein
MLIPRKRRDVLLGEEVRIKALRLGSTLAVGLMPAAVTSQNKGPDRDDRGLRVFRASV